MPRPGTRRICRANPSVVAYPSLSEHLASRRRFLTFVGASLLGSALPGCFVAGGKPGRSDYQIYRLPVSGELSATLADGAACRLYVNLHAYHDDVFPQTHAENASVAVLEAWVGAPLDTAEGQRDAESALEGVLAPLVDEVSSVALTIVELQP